MDFGYNEEFFNGFIGSVVDEGKKNYWWLGAIIYIAGSIMINFGSNIIKRDHMNMAKLEVTSVPPLYKRYLWIVGFVIFCVGNIINFIAFMFAAQSLLAALGSIQFVSNLIFAYFINGEKITKSSLIATAFIIGGNILIVIFGSKSNTNNDLESLKLLLFKLPFIIYLISITIAVILLQAIYLFFQYKIKQMSPTKPPIWMERYQPIAYAAVSAIIGTNSIIIGKACAGLLKNAFHGDTSTFTSLWLYGLIGAFLMITGFWLYRLNSALRLYDAMFIIPILQCIWLIFGVIGGGIFFEEFSDFNLLQSMFFIGGMVSLIFGILILRPSTKEEAKVINDNNENNVDINNSEVSIEMEKIHESK